MPYALPLMMKFQAKLKKGESVAIYKDKLMIMKWKDKKDIL
jgi:hypothetical protein